MKHEPIGDHAERKRILYLIERCEKEQRMSAYDQVYKAYTDSQKNGLWDAWGIVANPITIHELTADAKSRMELNYKVSGDVTTIFGLVVIPCAPCERDKVYVVDERLGRTILGQTERSRE